MCWFVCVELRRNDKGGRCDSCFGEGAGEDLLLLIGRVCMLVCVCGVEEGAWKKKTRRDRHRQAHTQRR